MQDITSVRERDGYYQWRATDVNPKECEEKLVT